MVRIFHVYLTVAILFVGPLALIAQTPRDTQKRNPRQTTRPTPQPSPETPAETEPEEQKDIDTVKINTDLVVVPVIANDLNGLYIPDLQRPEFSLEEDGVKQEIAFFATVSAPFHVVLMLDTSASTEEKLGLIRRAAITFVDQLQSGDRVKVISFDEEVRDLNEFTSDKAILKAAINKTRSGHSTKLYDAMDLALSTVRTIEGRKAIVLFTDGVDMQSVQATFNSTLRGLDEEGVIVYPIRYDMRAETEQIARQQSEEITPQLPTIDVIRRPPSGTTAPTFPGEGSETVPTSGTRPKTGPLGLPLPSEILRPRPGIDPNRLPSPDGLPPGSVPDRSRYPDPSNRTPPPGERDSVSAMLDVLYTTADSYLKALADKSGGKMLRADTLVSLPDAFAKIAAELRTQYALGYYPSNKARDDRYRRIKITTTRKNVVIRARPGYHSPADR
jgi:von Willebrand factor type A domain